MLHISASKQVGNRVGWSISGPAKSTAPVGEVDHGRLGPWARMTIVGFCSPSFRGTEGLAQRHVGRAQLPVSLAHVGEVVLLRPFGAPAILPPAPLFAAVACFCLLSPIDLNGHFSAHLCHFSQRQFWALLSRTMH